MGNQTSRDRRQQGQQDGPAGRTYPPAVQQQGQQGQQGQQAHPPPGPNYPSHPGQNNGQFYGNWRPNYSSRTNPPQGPPPGAPRPPQPAQELSQTSTIRNAVNLQKGTLRLVPVANDPGRLAIIFSFDASAPCKVTVFVMATEDAGHSCQLTTARQAPAPGIVYMQGACGLMFPKADGVSCYLDVGQYDRQLLLAPPENTYPLVVRMETVTPAGEAAGHTLQELQAGAHQTTWVQSQTTFVGLIDDDGVLLPRVKKQKIWVEGVSYELQEIYGMEHAAGSTQTKEGVETSEEAEERLCVICLVNNRDTTVLPCRHMCMCHECAQELRKQTSKCPICREQVDSLLHIKMQKAAHKVPTGAAAAAAAQKIEELKL